MGELAPMFIILFPASLNQGQIPDYLLDINDVEICRKNEYKAEHYHPVLSKGVTSTLLDHLISSNVIKYLEKNIIRLYSLTFIM